MRLAILICIPIAILALYVKIEQGKFHCDHGQAGLLLTRGYYRSYTLMWNEGYLWSGTNFVPVYYSRGRLEVGSYVIPRFHHLSLRGFGTNGSMIYIDGNKKIITSPIQ